MGEWVAILMSSAALLLSAAQYLHRLREERPRLVLHAECNDPGDAIGAEQYIVITARNPRSATVTVEAAGLRVVGHTQVVNWTLDCPGDRIPLEVSRYKAVRWYLAVGYVAEALLRAGIADQAKLVPFCVDGMGNRYEGKALRFPPDEAASG